MSRIVAAILAFFLVAAPGSVLAAQNTRAPIYFPDRFEWPHNGTWKDRPLVSEKWLAMARTPGPANKYYGFANWYLNTDRAVIPAAPASAVRFVGNGNNIVYIDWDNDIVAVVRWIRNDAALNDVVGKMLAAIEEPER